MAALWEMWLSQDGEAWEAVTDGGSLPHRYSDWSTLQREAEHWAEQYRFVQIRLVRRD
jgi:hypothetical protein